MIHDPAAFFDEASNTYYVYSTGAIGQRSSDMIHFEELGKVVPEVPAEAKEWTKSEDIWAPDIVKVGDEYRLYCSNSSWGVQQSCIFLAVSNSPEGPFLPRGIVLKTSDALPCNGIDANIITDVKTGQMYMLYGSFWGGCFVLPLDTKTGLAAEEGVGTNVACRPSWQSGAIEGPYMIYHPIFEYYYLFVSYGSLKSDYNIRVGRSKSITGPFLDCNGCDLLSPEDEKNTTGNLLMAGYQWNDGDAYMAPGHNSVLLDADGSYYLVNHIRKKSFVEDMRQPSEMQVRKMHFSTEGWPYVEAEEYHGEEDVVFTTDDLIGFYERIDFVSSLPQGISVATPMRLGENSYYEHCSIQGKWQYDGKNHAMQIAYGPHKEECFVSMVYDTQRGCKTIGICGIRQEGVAFMAKKIESK